MRLSPLPIDDAIPEALDALRRTRALVLVAPPGAGKTTRVPPAVLRAGLLHAEHPNLVMLQPRRVAARASAMRIAEEQGWTLGQEVGYHVRFERNLTRDTRLRVLTEGILTRQLLSDPFLDDVGCVVLDEFHERNLNTDLAIAMLREVQQTVREDLILIVMSATLDAEPVAQYLDGCPVVRSLGRTFPIETIHLQPSAGFLDEQVVDVVHRVIAGDLRDDSVGGDVLVFLPGAEEIRRTAQALKALADHEGLLVVPLHGSLPFEEQARALRPADRRKVILATNIAETSLTIEGVRTVIDSGKARVASFDPQRGLDRLDLEWISQASATQRAGRAGRTAPGRAIRLWSSKQHHALPAFDTPEVKRVDLASTVLALHAWGTNDPRTFGWFERPAEEALASAENLLTQLGAIEVGGISDKRSITMPGRRILQIPAHPRLARLLIEAADRGIARDGALIAALLSEKDILQPDRTRPPAERGPATLASSDLIIRMQAFVSAEQSGFRGGHLVGIDLVAARQVARARDHFLSIARQSSPHASSARPANETELLQLPLLAYPDRVARRRPANPTAGVMVGGVGLKLAAESVVRDAEFFLALDARRDERSPSREALVRIASAIEIDWLERLFPQSIVREQSAVLDEPRGIVVGRSTLRYLDLPLVQRSDAAVEPREAQNVLLAHLTPSRVREMLETDERCKPWLDRITFLQRALPDEAWPDLSDAGILRSLAESAVAGKRSLDAVRQVLPEQIRGLLHYPLDRLLETEAPESVEVPTGNRIRLQYASQASADVTPPVLAVRLQELFGLADTPRIARGRVAVILHLLGPNHRPVQVTRDLKSFWANTYAQVRKDLKARYPKHSWPENPLTAPPQAKGSRRTR